MKFVCTILTILLSITLYSQQYDPTKVNRKAAALYSQALQLATDGNFKEGISLLQQAVQVDKNFLDDFLSIACMYGEMKNYDSAIINYEKGLTIDSLYFKDYNL